MRKSQLPIKHSVLLSTATYLLSLLSLSLSYYPARATHLSLSFNISPYYFFPFQSHPRPLFCFVSISSSRPSLVVVAEMKKLVLKINMLDDGDKRKAMKTVAGFPGIDSISIDMKERKLTIIGTADPTKVVSRLRKYWTTELVSVGPAKEPEKEEPKKDEAKKEEAAGDNKPAENEPKKEGGGEEKKKADQPKKGEEVEKEGGEGAKANVEAVSRGGEGGGAKKEEEEEKKVDPVLEMVKAYRAYNPQMTKYYYVQSMEENPNACVIC